MESVEPNSKVATRRLQDPVSSRRSTFQNKTDRIPRACIRCRTRKVRCPGERPCCRRCENSGVQCVYTDTRRDRLKEYCLSCSLFSARLTVGSTTSQNRQLITLLRDVSLRASDGDRKRINELLDLVCIPHARPLTPNEWRQQAIYTNTCTTVQTCVIIIDVSEDQRGRSF